VNRWLALGLAVIGGALIALIIVGGFTAVLMGALWIFVFGDDPWPGWVETVLNLLLPIVALAVWFFEARHIFLRLTRESPK
jgi:hypothetical protein